MRKDETDELIKEHVKFLNYQYEETKHQASVVVVVPRSASKKDTKKHYGVIHGKKKVVVAKPYDFLNGSFERDVKSRSVSKVIFDMSLDQVEAEDFNIIRDALWLKTQVLRNEDD